MKRTKLIVIIPPIALAIVYSIAFSLFFAGCSTETEQNNSNTAQVTNLPVKAATADMSAGVVTINGKQVNLGEIPLPAKQPKQFTITPKLLYALGYEASGGNEFLITFTNIDVGLVEETISDIKLKTGIKNIEFKTLNRHLDPINDISVCDIAIYPISNEEAVRIADYGISQNSYFKAGLAQVNTEKYYPELSEQEFQEFMQGNLKSKLTISTQELFNKTFQYKVIIDRLNQCSNKMKTLDGILECYSDKDGNYYQDRDMVADLYMLEQNEPNLSSNERHKIVEKQILDEIMAKEANGAYKSKFNNFQTTYKKLFGSEYIAHENIQANMPTQNNNHNISNDNIENQAHRLMTGSDMVSPNDIIVKTNSKGIKIYCLSNMSICKTESEVTSYSKIK